MNLSTIIAIILGWLLFNTWLSYLILALAKEDVSYNELHWLILASVITPLTIPIINLIIVRRRERRKTR